VETSDVNLHLLRYDVRMNAKSLLLIACLFTPAILLLTPARPDMKTPATDQAKNNLVAVAVHLNDNPDADGFPASSAWQKAQPLHYEHDWKGENPDPQRATEVRLLWTPETLFIQFHCNYRNITVFPDARDDGWRNGMWERDVAETFLQPDATDPFVYKEFEVSPNNFWIDLAVSHFKIEELHSGLRRRVVLDEKSKSWTADLAIPMKGLTPQFDPKHSWRANFYRIEGEKEPRFYSAWSPTFTPKPSFHVPAAFGTLVFHEPL
jgi:alpha-galactosidase